MQYLTLPDILKAFSYQVIPLLTERRMPLELSHPSPVFIKNILGKIETGQIVSLEMKTHSLCSANSLDWLTKLTSITLLTLCDPHRLNRIPAYTLYLPNLTRLSLSYEYEIDFCATRNVLESIEPTIQRLEIHCNEARCTHLSWHYSSIARPLNLTIKYLLIDINHVSLSPWNSCLQGHQFCFLNSTIALIKGLPNIQQVRFITSIHNLKILLDAGEWKTLFGTCSHLSKIRMDILGGISDRKQLLQKAVELQSILQNEQPKLKVQFVCL